MNKGKEEKQKQANTNKMIETSPTTSIILIKAA